MDEIIAFLVDNEKVVWAMMSFIIFGIIYALKIPYKKLTSKITNEKVRQLANKAIVILTFAVSIGLTLGYSELVDIDFSLSHSIKYAVSAIAIYSATEIKKGNKDIPFTTEEAKEVIDTAVQAVTVVETETKKAKKEKKKKKKETETTETENTSAIGIFLTDVGHSK